MSARKRINDIFTLRDIINAKIATARVSRQMAFDALMFAVADLGEMNPKGQEWQSKLQPIVNELLRVIPEILEGRRVKTDCWAIDPVCQLLKVMLYEERRKAIERIYNDIANDEDED